MRWCETPSHLHLPHGRPSRGVMSCHRQTHPAAAPAALLHATALQTGQVDGNDLRLGPAALLLGGLAPCGLPDLERRPLAARCPLVSGLLLACGLDEVVQAHVQLARHRGVCALIWNCRQGRWWRGWELRVAKCLRGAGAARGCGAGRITRLLDEQLPHLVMRAQQQGCQLPLTHNRTELLARESTQTAPGSQPSYVCRIALPQLHNVSYTFIVPGLDCSADLVLVRVLIDQCPRGAISA